MQSSERTVIAGGINARRFRFCLRFADNNDSRLYAAQTIRKHPAYLETPSWTIDGGKLALSAVERVVSAADSVILLPVNRDDYLGREGGLFRSHNYEVALRRNDALLEVARDLGKHCMILEGNNADVWMHQTQEFRIYPDAAA